jgi:hypothetical protein
LNIECGMPEFKKKQKPANSMSKKKEEQ